MPPVEGRADDELFVGNARPVVGFHDVPGVQAGLVALGRAESRMMSCAGAVHHVVGHELHIVHDFRNLIHLGIRNAPPARPYGDGHDTAFSKIFPQRCQQGGEVLLIPGVRADARGVAAGVLPVNVNAVQIIFFHRVQAGSGKIPAAFLRHSHVGEAVRAPSAHGQDDLHLRIPFPQLRQQVEIFQQMQIQQPVLNESEGQIHVGQAPGVLPGEARQGIVPAVGNDIIFHGIHAPYFSSFCHYSSAQ